jgi:type II secretory pathway pseudopilin PulG
MLLERNNKGHTLLEVTVVAAVIGLLLLIVMVYFMQAQKSQTLSTNNETRTSVLKQINDLMAAAMTAPGVAIFDPATTLTAEANPPRPAGFWRMEAPSQTPNFVDTSTAQSFDLGSGVALTQSSHALVSYKLTIDSSGMVNKTLKYALLSRCVDATQANPPSALPEVMALRVPVMIAKKLYCCNGLSDCPESGSDDAKYWPTIFLFRPNTPTQFLPSAKERGVIPGAGFMVTFDSHLMPKSAHFSAFILENKCRNTDVGYEGRAPLNCTVTSLGKPFDSHYAIDVTPISVMETSRALTTDMTGSSFIKL